MRLKRADLDAVPAADVTDARHTTQFESMVGSIEGAIEALRVAQQRLQVVLSPVLREDKIDKSISSSSYSESASELENLINIVTDHLYSMAADTNNLADRVSL